MVLEQGRSGTGMLVLVCRCSWPSRAMGSTWLCPQLPLLHAQPHGTGDAGDALLGPAVLSPASGPELGRGAGGGSPAPPALGRGSARSWDGGGSGAAPKGRELWSQGGQEKPGVLQRGLSPRREALPFGACSSLPLVTGGDSRAAFPSGSRWHGENPSVFCNMVASTRPKGRFAAGPVPIWLGAAEDGQGTARPGRGGLGAGELPVPPSAASWGQLSSCPAANRGQKASCSSPGSLHRVLIVLMFQVGSAGIWGNG